MLAASITNWFVHFATNVVADLGLGGIFVLMLAESACVPIPSEATMLFAGFNVFEGHYSLLTITLVGVAGNLAGSWLAYAVGYYGRLELVERHAHKLHINPKHVAWADRWFARYGDATVFFTRMLPIIRTFISLPAGVARMPFLRFTVFTLLGCVPWVLLLAFIGDQVGSTWRQWEDSLRYVDYAVLVAAVGAIAYLAARRIRSRGRAASQSRDHQQEVGAPDHDGAEAEHEAGLHGEAGGAHVTQPPPAPSVERKPRREPAEVPGEPEDQRYEPKRDPKPAQQTRRRGAAPVQKRHRTRGKRQ